MQYNQNGFANGSMGSMRGAPRPGGGWGFGAIVRDLIAAWRLLWDPAVPGLLKLAIPFLAMLYFIWPLDLLPGLPFDDIGILLLASRLFVRLAPQDRAYKAYPGSGHASSSHDFDGDSRRNGKPDDDDHDVIDTTWQVVDDK
ncbi:MAG: hypothetical protein WDZ49_10120 [Litorilinea sp.]